VPNVATARGNTGSPSGDCGRDQLATRERQAGPCGVAERSVVPMKLGNSGGGKGPQLKTDDSEATSSATQVLPGFYRRLT
jgi:hypothetical protein